MVDDTAGMFAKLKAEREADKRRLAWVAWLTGVRPLRGVLTHPHSLGIGQVVAALNRLHCALAEGGTIEAAIDAEMANTPQFQADRLRQQLGDVIADLDDA